MDKFNLDEDILKEGDNISKDDNFIIFIYSRLVLEIYVDV